MALFVISLLGFVLMIATGLFGVVRVPGIHYDEAWAGNYAHRILTEKPFWPIDAMSPYTHPWAHYITAAFFKVFGTSLFVYRGAGVAMCVTGAFLAWVALVRIGEKKAAMLFPYLLALFVPFVCNERLCVEITTFHILCLGLLVLGAQLRSMTLVFIAVFFGATSHILFLAPVLALLGVWGLQSGRWQMTHRVLAIFTALSLWPFLWKVYREIPEKDKAALLLAADALIVGFALFFEQMPRWIRRMRENIKGFIAFVSIPFFFYCVVFSEGHWSILFTHGKILHPWILFLSVPLTAVGIFFLARCCSRQSWTAPQQRFWTWMVFTVFWAGALAVKPAPRYFSIVFFLMALAGAILLARLSYKKILGFMIPFAVVSLLVLSLNYILPGLRGEGEDRSYRFLLFRDSSEDSLSKQDLARYLGEKGCAFSGLIPTDPRIAEALKFLSYGDWPVSSEKRCPSAHYRVERLAAQGVTEGPSSEVFKQFKVTWSE